MKRGWSVTDAASSASTEAAEIQSRPRIAVVVPVLAEGGGVPAVAEFIASTIERSARYEVKLISLAMSSRDASSAVLRDPRTWRALRVTKGVWNGRPFTHAGTLFPDFEFMRYRPRHCLTELVADCDLIQVVCGSPAWANAVVDSGKPIALHVATRARVERRQRDADPRRLSDWWRKGMTTLTDRLDVRALHRVDAIQVMNPWMFEYVRALNTGREVDLRYAPPGVNAEVFRPRDGREPQNEPYILCVARLDDPRKNIGLLLEAYAQLPDAVRNEVRLMLAGSSGPGDTFWRQAEALGLRERIGYVAQLERDALVRLYQGASVFALPSDEEGFGMVLLEAMACGVPVVSTRSGGPDGIITDGEDGYLVPRDDAAALSSRLARLLQDPDLNVAMGQRARQTIERRYDERVAGEVFVEMWDRLAHRSRTA